MVVDSLKRLAIASTSAEDLQKAADKFPDDLELQVAVFAVEYFEALEARKLERPSFFRWFFQVFETRDNASLLVPSPLSQKAIEFFEENSDMLDLALLPQPSLFPYFFRKTRLSWSEVPLLLHQTTFKAQCIAERYKKDLPLSFLHPKRINFCTLVEQTDLKKLQIEYHIVPPFIRLGEFSGANESARRGDFELTEQVMRDHLHWLEYPIAATLQFRGLPLEEVKAFVERRASIEKGFDRLRDILWESSSSENRYWIKLVQALVSTKMFSEASICYQHIDSPKEKFHLLATNYNHGKEAGDWVLSHLKDLEGQAAQLSQALINRCCDVFGLIVWAKCQNGELSAAITFARQARNYSELAYKHILEILDDEKLMHTLILELPEERRNYYTPMWPLIKKLGRDGKYEQAETLLGTLKKCHDYVQADPDQEQFPARGILPYVDLLLEKGEIERIHSLMKRVDKGTRLWIKLKVMRNDKTFEELKKLDFKQRPHLHTELSC